MSETYSLDTWDYVVFSLFLALVSAIGLYHSFARGGQQSTQEYLLANRSVLSIPVAMTLLASFVSPLTLLGDPAEVYINGGIYLNSVFSSLFVYPVIIVVFIPVFYGLDITSAYEYLDQRFDMKVRILGAAVFFFQTGFYMAIVTYSPALAIEAVTDFELWITILITGIVCTIYTSLGGMKAVIWTDVVMFCVMFGTMIMVLVMGCIEAGGFTYVWEFNKEEDRLDIFDFPKDLTAHMSFPSVVIGNGVNMLALWAVGQTSVQRMLAAKSLKDAKISMWLNMPFTVLIKFLAAFQGLVLYAYYFGGSITTTPAVTTVLSDDLGALASDGPRTPPNYTSSDQILIYFISEQFGHIPGYQGLFIACLFASTLSSVSSGINAMTAVTLVDIIRPLRAWKRKRAIAQGKVPEGKDSEPSESYDTIITKVFTVIYGCMTIGLAFLATKMGTLISMAYTIFGAIGGPLVGTFALGILWKRANSMGTLIGLVSGAALGIWVAVGSTVTDSSDEDTFGLYKLSVMWFGTFTVLTTVVIGVICSEIVRFLYPEERERKINPELLATFLRPKEIDSINDVALKHLKENGENGDVNDQARHLASSKDDKRATEKHTDQEESIGECDNKGFSEISLL